MKKRIISAVVAIVILVPLLILGGLWFNVGVCILGIIGFNELLLSREKYKSIPILVKIVSMISFILLMYNGCTNNGLFLIDYKIIIVSILLITLPLLIYEDRNVYDPDDAFYLLGSVLFLGIAFNFLITLRGLSLYYVIYIVLVTTMSDTFAHFFGTQIGKNKLCPTISPNKTIEGMVGGTLFGTFIPTIFFITFVDYSCPIIVVILVSLFLSLVSQFGDLIFSSIKRKYDIKDFGKIMPGHGGVLDRFDSLILVILAFALVESLI